MNTSPAASRWSVVAAFTVVGAATQIVWLTYAPVTTAAADRFGVSENAVGWLANLFPLFYVLLAIPAGVLLDRWFRGGGRRRSGAHRRRCAAEAGRRLVCVGARGAVPRRDRATVGAQRDHRCGRPLPARGGPPDRHRRRDGQHLRRHGRRFRPRGRPAGPRVAHRCWSRSARRSRSSARSRSPWRSGGRASSGIPRRSQARDALRAAVRDPFVRKVCLLVFFPFGTFIALTTFGQALLEPAGVSAATASVILLVAVVAGVAGCAVVPVVAARRRAELPVMTVGLVLSARGLPGPLGPGPRRRSPGSSR